MAVIFAFNIVMWMFQCSLSLMSLNGKAGTVLLFLIYVFIDSIGEFIAHLFNGFTLLNGIPDNEIVYIDETSFHLWMSPGRLWIKQGMRVQLPDQREQSMTMIGALSVH